MRLVDLDKFAVDAGNGKTAVMKLLDRYEKEHPLTRIAVRKEDDWMLALENEKEHPSTRIVIRKEDGWMFVFERKKATAE